MHTILRWHDEGLDVNSRLPVLSRYMGHETISETYWYLTGTPELMEVATSAFESHFHGRVGVAGDGRQGLRRARGGG